MHLSLASLVVEGSTLKFGCPYQKTVLVSLRFESEGTLLRLFLQETPAL